MIDLDKQLAAVPTYDFDGSPIEDSLHFEMLVDGIEMKAYGKPIIEHFATHDSDKAGFSLVQLIETSSITGHFVDKNGDFYLDVFSCKEYDIQKVIKFVNNYFEPKSIKDTYLLRQS